MKDRTRLLAGILAAQIVLVAVLWLLNRAPSAAGQPLLEVEVAQVDEVIVEGPKDARVMLRRSGEDWLVDGAFPAQSSKVKTLLEDLAKVVAGAPVATSNAAAARFRVSDEDFERRITLQGSGRQLARLYLGSSPGFRRVHARRGEDNEVYEIAFSAFDVPDSAGGWQDRDLLKMPLEEIEAITRGELEMVRHAAKAAMAGPGEGGDPSSGAAEAAPEWTATRKGSPVRLKSGAASHLASLLANLTFEAALVGDAASEAAEGGKVALELEVRRRGVAQPITYRFERKGEEGPFTLHVSTRPEPLRVAAYVVQPLIDAAGDTALLEDSRSSR
ncbi:MAG: DUF4340 domain-containing protein [Pseudomonadota bacterium]|jgi:hypothetical protein|nr:MAG: hypothetical protein DIU62_00695 [Pseudomonadota bacterium]